MTTAPIFSILTICTGNICRSPLAEASLRSSLSGLPWVAVGSAGTHALDGDTMPLEAIALGEHAGITTTGHRARPLTRDLVSTSSLVLGLGRDHRSAAISLFPRANRFAFTLREFARIAADLATDELAHALRGVDSPEARAGAAVALVASRRGLSERPASPADDDVVDPYRRSAAVYETCGQQLFPAAQTVGRFLLGAAAG